MDMRRYEWTKRTELLFYLSECGWEWSQGGGWRVLASLSCPQRELDRGWEALVSSLHCQLIPSAPLRAPTATDHLHLLQLKHAEGAEVGEAKPPVEVAGAQLEQVWMRHT